MSDDNRVYLFDTALRDSLRARGVNFAVADKSTVAAR